MDRFLFKLVVSHADAKIDSLIIRKNLDGSIDPALTGLSSVAFDRKKFDEEIQRVTVDDSVLAYISRILELSRSHPMLSIGSSVRGGLALARCARISAALGGRDFVTPDDVKQLAVPSLRHRIRTTPEAQMAGETEVQILGDILKKAEFPA